MKHWLLRIALALGAGLHPGASAGASAAALTLMAPITPGLMEKDARTGAWHGPAVELIENLMREAGLDIAWVDAPAARMLRDAKALPLHCAVGAARSPAQEKSFLWFGPLSRTRIVVLARPNEVEKSERILDLKGRSVGVARESLGAELLTQHGVPFTAVADHQTAYRMLLKGRLDFWVVNELAAAHIVSKGEGPAPKLVFVMHGVENYLACHQGLPTEVQARLQSAVQTLLRRGAMEPFGVARLEGPPRPK